MFEQSVTHLATLRVTASGVFDDVAEEGGRASQTELTDLLAAARAARNAIEAVELAVLAQLARREHLVTPDGPVVRVRPLGSVDEFAPGLAAMTLGTSTAAAGRQMALGARLASRLPGTLRLMAAGVLDCARASRVDLATEGLSPETCRRVEAQLLPRLPDLEPGRVGSEVRRVASRVAPQEHREAVTRERAKRDVDISPGPDGTTLWWAQLPSETSAAMWAAITTRAAQLRCDDRSLTAGQARADAFTDLVLGRVRIATSLTLGLPVVESGGAFHCPPSEPGEAFVMASTPASINGVDCWVSGVEVAKVGYIPPDAVAGLMRGLDVRVGRALLAADSGVLRETVSDAYRPPRRMREFVELRDGTCRMFGCTRPAVHADVDHAVPWPRGQTTPAGLSGLCRRHHRMKHHPSWRFALDRDGIATWTTPTGVTRRTYPVAMSPETLEPANPQPQTPGPPSWGTNADPAPPPF